MAPTTPLTSSNVALTVPNGIVADATPYVLVSGDVSNGLSIPASLFASPISGLAFSQAGFLPEKLRIRVNTTVAGTAFKITVKAAQPKTDVPNLLPASPQANLGDLGPFDVSTTGLRTLGPFNSGRVLQPDGSLLINFSGTLGTTSIWVLLDPYAPVGPRG
jgi:hypothetical protein